jgi:hypothetical protein
MVVPELDLTEMEEELMVMELAEAAEKELCIRYK